MRLVLIIQMDYKKNDEKKLLAETRRERGGRERGKRKRKGEYFPSL